MAKALIFAGGSGLRMNSKSKPKQFLMLHGKPVIIYTLEHFEDNAQIDGIIVVCKEDWISKLNHMLEKYGIKKVISVISGGDSAFESIYFGLVEMKKYTTEDEIVLIHDGVRPLITESLIDRNIETAMKKGNAITVDFVRESVVEMQEHFEIGKTYPREDMRIAKAPQTFRYSDILKEIEKAYNAGESYIDMSSMMYSKGYTLNTVQSCDYNIKITTAADFYIFKAILDALDDSQIFGLDMDDDYDNK